MNRWDIINFFIEKNNYKSYLEIEYYKNWSFNRIICKNKTTVDPNPSKELYQENPEMYGKCMGETYSDGTFGEIFKMTSDEFFNTEIPYLDEKGNVKSVTLRKDNSIICRYDIIFIDGLHERGQVLRDMRNAFTCLNEGGVVIMHDCNPPKEAHTKEGIDGCWTGDVYKAMLDIRNSPQCDAYVIDTDWGVGVVRPVHELKKKDITDIEHYNALYDWEYFDHARKQLLGLVDISTFIAKERYNLPVLEL